MTPADVAEAQTLLAERDRLQKALDYKPPAPVKGKEWVEERSKWQIGRTYFSTTWDQHTWEAFEIDQDTAVGLLRARMNEINVRLIRLGVTP